MRHPRALDWESKLKAVFDRIDVELEARYGRRYPLHPARSKLGATANPEQDGLFNVGAAFSPGYGSELGTGYVVSLRVVTLKNVPKPLLNEMEDFVVERLRQELPSAFPGKQLKVSRDGEIFKIHGDLSLRD